MNDTETKKEIHYTLRVRYASPGPRIRVQNTKKFFIYIVGGLTQTSKLVFKKP